MLVLGERLMLNGPYLHACKDPSMCAPSQVLQKMERAGVSRFKFLIQ